MPEREEVDRRAAHDLVGAEVDREERVDESEGAARRHPDQRCRGPTSRSCRRRRAPKNAPISIIPSSAMFTTPLRSEKSPPRAANVSGVDQRSVAAISADQTKTRSRFGRLGLHRGDRPGDSDQSRGGRAAARAPLAAGERPRSRQRPRAIPSAIGPAGVRTVKGGSASQKASDPEHDPGDADRAGRRDPVPEGRGGRASRRRRSRPGALSLERLPQRVPA